MKIINEVSVKDWLIFFHEFANSNGDNGNPTSEINEGQIDRRPAFYAIQALLRGGIFTTQDPIGKLHIKSLIKKKLSSSVKTFLKDIYSVKLKSIGIHIVDPIEGRKSSIWMKPDIYEDKKGYELGIQKCELYSNAWNRIYRRLFRPSATLINASKVAYCLGSGIQLSYRQR